MSLPDLSIYENDTSINFWVTTPIISVFAGSFDFVRSRGLRTSSLSFSSTLGNVAAAITIGASVDSTFVAGDTLYVSLPGFTAAKDVANVVLKRSLLGITPQNNVNVTWSDFNNTLRIFVLGTTSVVNFTVAEVNGIVTPVTGCNNITGIC